MFYDSPSTGIKKLADRNLQQIVLLQPNPNPLIPLTPHIKVPSAIPNISDLLILVQMLVEKGLYLAFVGVTESFWADSDFVAVLVGAFLGESVHVGE